MVGPFLVRCLAHPRNRDVAQEVAAAVRLGIPLSVARGARLPGEAWTTRDWALAQAVEMLDRSRCHGCGHPTWLSHDPKLEKKWRSPTPDRCHACTAVAKRQKQYEGDDVAHPQALFFHAELPDGSA